MAVLKSNESVPYRNRQTDRVVVPVFHIGDQLFVRQEDGTLNNWKIRTFFENHVLDRPALCWHCGFLEVEAGGILCPNCRDRFQ